MKQGIRIFALLVLTTSVLACGKKKAAALDDAVSDDTSTPLFSQYFVSDGDEESDLNSVCSNSDGAGFDFLVGDVTLDSARMIYKVTSYSIQIFILGFTSVDCSGGAYFVTGLDEEGNPTGLDTSPTVIVEFGDEGSEYELSGKPKDSLLARNYDANNERYNWLTAYSLGNGTYNLVNGNEEETFALTTMDGWSDFMDAISESEGMVLTPYVPSIVGQ